ncbi:hypothetical protein ACE15N_23610 (plasmid) [Xanthomonas campestris pv. passiflorae]|uniref:hypothetical protein n=2 Tax=Xanthomonas TaxID=338 RepID=UPI000528F8C7|nr:hypothetical protein [Xanthomonas vasicola]ATS74345.1 hypothetical protein XcfCFBP6166P_23255 [Xanthomonas citri pv. phaseoli var. fuscans]KGP22435.1 hypothetical protein NY65_19530 [Xanthomonas phaseoli pv. phaseoli]KGP22828.1 hypothetical protein NY67_18900 [Xanthomonas citri pv. fuscans]PNV26462.1 hypothetical protein xavtCFBP7764_23540 [Xanthomonas citri]ATS78575.1 hypothetical protein XcfCFBP6975P_23535 [Xanthomonas citri pv. phaseoli var. fuscans]
MMASKEHLDDLDEQARELMRSGHDAGDLDKWERGERLAAEVQRQRWEIPTVKDLPGGLRRLGFGLVLTIAGLAVLWAAAGGWVALGVFLVLWGVDLRQRVTEDLLKALRSALTW